MICDQLTPAKLSSLIKEELDSSESAWAVAHIESCANCRDRYQKTQAMLVQLMGADTWKQRNDLGYQYKESATSGIRTEMDSVSITEDYLDNQETIRQQIQEQMKKAPWWLLSFALNGILLALCTLIIIGKAKEPWPENIIQAELPPKSEPEYDPETERDLIEEKKEIPKTDPKITEKSEVVVPEDVEVSDHMEADTQSDFNEMAEADLDNQMLADKSGDIGKFTGLGAGGGSGGAFGQRGRGGRHWLVKRGGGSTKTESAMEAALLWLKRHQSMEKDKNGEEEKDLGLWLQEAWLIECSGYKGANKGGGSNNTKKFPGICEVLNPKEVRKVRYYHPFAMTGMALLAYAGAGYSHKRGHKYKKTIKRALNLLTKTLDETREVEKPGTLNALTKGNERVAFIKLLRKKTSGLIGIKIKRPNGDDRIMYQHGIVNLALNEIYGVSRDAYLKKYALEMTMATLKDRGSVSGGWDYEYGQQTSYSSSTGVSDLGPSTWAIMALKAAKGVGILADAAKAVGTTKKQVQEDMKKTLEDAMAPNSFVGFRYRYRSPTGKGKNYFALGLADIAFLYKGEKMREKMKPFVEYLSKQILEGGNGGRFLENYWGTKENKKASYYYFMYYNTLALFQYGGDIWEKYNKKNSEWLLNNQHQGKKQCLDGSWETDVGNVFYSRVWSTTVNALQLQVYYRYKKHGGKNKKK